MKRANTMSTITVELIIKMKTKFTSSNAEKTNGFISPQMSNFHTNAEGGELMRSLLAEFLRGFSLRILIFLLDMVLPQLDAYHAGRQLQHPQPWTSVVLAQRQERGQPGLELVVRYGYEAFAGFHVVQLLTDGIPLLLFSDPKAVPSVSPWSLCVNGNLGSMEANVMAGRALFGRFQLPDGLRRCAIFLVQEKVMQGTSRSADSRAYRRFFSVQRRMPSARSFNMFQSMLHMGLID